MDRFEFFHMLPAMSSTDRSRVQNAYELAKLAHHNQFRDTGVRYFEHVRDVTIILLEYGYTDAHQIIIGFTHDVLEDTFIPFSFLECLFGYEIATDVSILSKSYGVSDSMTGFVIRTERKTDEQYFGAIAHAHQRVIVAKCADRIHNLQSFPDPEDEAKWTQERRMGKVHETRQYIIPLAEKHDPRMALRLTQLCNDLETTAQRIISSRPPPPSNA